MEQTITQSGALYFVQHKEALPTTRRSKTKGPRSWNFRIKSVDRRLPRIRSRRVVFPQDDELDNYAGIQIE